MAEQITVKTTKTVTNEFDEQDRLVKEVTVTEVVETRPDRS